MTGVVGVAGMIAVAAITPGPNNLVVLRAAIGSGFLGAIPVMLAIIAGGLVVVGAALAGAGVAFAADGRLRGALAIVGSLYMVWLGIRSIVDARRAHLPLATHGTRRHDTVRGLFLFQLMNPKCWVMVLTAVAAAPGRPWLLAPRS